MFGVCIDEVGDRGSGDMTNVDVKTLLEGC